MLLYVGTCCVREDHKMSRSKRFSARRSISGKGVVHEGTEQMDHNLLVINAVSFTVIATKPASPWATQESILYHARNHPHSSERQLNNCQMLAL
jgi:hypothetical protein